MNRATPGQLWPQVAPEWMLNLPEGLEDLFYRFYKSLIFDNRYEMYIEGLNILDTAYALEEYAASVSKDNPELYAAINGALEELIADGTVAAIVEKYIPAA